MFSFVKCYKKYATDWSFTNKFKANENAANLKALTKEILSIK